MARFRRRARLLIPPQFERVFGQGRKLRTPHLTAVVASSDTGHPRLGLAIARKAAPKAVDRNRIKRLARESFRVAQNLLPSCDVVLLATPSAVKASSAGLRRDLDSLWTRIAS